MGNDRRPAWRVDTSAIVARQEIDPRNRDDADYILAHPRDFTAEQYRIALVTEERVYGTSA